MCLILVLASMLTRHTPGPLISSRTRRFCAIAVAFVLLCLLHQYIWFGLSYAYYAVHLHILNSPRYTIIVSTSVDSKPADVTTPLILHQTYRTRDSVPEKWRNTSESCRHTHRHWAQQYFWSDESGREFIAKHFSAEALANYDSYVFPIQRADALRYYVLYYYGGVYLDLDIGCLAALDRVGVTRYPFGLASTVPIGFSNDFMMARARHPFLKHLIERLARHNHWYINYYLTVMYSTGPMFLTINYLEYMREQERGDSDSVYVLNETLYGAVNHSASLFYHVEGSSWHNYRLPSPASI